MKKNNGIRYRYITSFKDFHREREILMLRSKIIDTRISLEIQQLKSRFSLSDLFLSAAREYLFPELAEFLRSFSGRTGK